MATCMLSSFPKVRHLASHHTPSLSECLSTRTDHAVKMHEVPDDYLADVIRLAKKVAIDHGLVDYNIIQNNGRIAYQSVDHVHFHVIDKPDVDTGLVVKWPPQKSPEELEVYRAELFKKMGAEGKTLYDD
ncbi:HIT-like protein [Chiua virens]|nr:HIT-like protein [Chiua virens]